ncbi:hypothetical protein DESC_810164 [Desulfosarcina cetonica]|nr:hypothetical protein DESC_810164 [Desulfosarcina cetonica]
MCTENLRYFLLSLEVQALNRLLHSAIGMRLLICIKKRVFDGPFRGQSRFQLDCCR